MMIVNIQVFLITIGIVCINIDATNEHKYTPLILNLIEVVKGLENNLSENVFLD